MWNYKILFQSSYTANRDPSMQFLVVYKRTAVTSNAVKIYPVSYRQDIINQTVIFVTISFFQDFIFPVPIRGLTD